MTPYLVIMFVVCAIGIAFVFEKSSAKNTPTGKAGVCAAVGSVATIPFLPILAAPMLLASIIFILISFGSSHYKVI